MLRPSSLRSLEQQQVSRAPPTVSASGVHAADDWDPRAESYSYSPAPMQQQQAPTGRVSLSRVPIAGRTVGFLGREGVPRQRVLSKFIRNLQPTAQELGQLRFVLFAARIWDPAQTGQPLEDG